MINFAGATSKATRKRAIAKIEMKIQDLKNVPESLLKFSQSGGSWTIGIIQI